jgi:hypothetical protein
MNFISKNTTAFAIIVALCVTLGYIGDGSPPHLQEVKQMQQK